PLVSGFGSLLCFICTFCFFVSTHCLHCPGRLNRLEWAELTTVRIVDPHFRPRDIEADLQTWADELLQDTMLQQHLSSTYAHFKTVGVRIVNIILLDAVVLVEMQLVNHLRVSVAWGENFENHLRRDIAFEPLLIRTAVSPGPAKDNENVWCIAYLG